MPTIMQNLVVLIEPSDSSYDISSKAGIMCMNRFCIDEDAAFELSAVHDLDESFNDVYRSSRAKGREFF